LAVAVLSEGDPLKAPFDAVLVRQAVGHVEPERAPGSWGFGAGTAHHIAFNVETDDALVGWGECSDNRNPLGIAGCVSTVDVGPDAIKGKRLRREAPRWRTTALAEVAAQRQIPPRWRAAVWPAYAAAVAVPAGARVRARSESRVNPKPVRRTASPAGVQPLPSSSLPS